MKNIKYEISRLFDIRGHRNEFFRRKFDNLIINERRTGRIPTPINGFSRSLGNLSPKLLRSILLAGINRRAYEVSWII